MQTLRADGLTSVYGEKTLFNNISFIINEGDRVGLIGTNGSGKNSGSKQGHCTACGSNN